MGVSTGAIKLYLELWQRGLFDNLESVIEMGSQELHLPHGAFEELLDSAGISDYDRTPFANLANFPGFPRCPARNLYKLLGVSEYRCIDMNGEHESIPHDLNEPFNDTTLYGQFDLVTDHGANEHVFNIAETYRTTHRLCKPGGIILIIQALYGGNGYYNFDQSFFEGMAAANDYSILYSSFLVGLAKKYDIKELGPNPSMGKLLEQFHIPLSRELIDVLDWNQDIPTVGICYAFRKNSDNEFKYAYQGEYLAQTQKNAGYRLQFLPIPPSRTYLPLRGVSEQSSNEGILNTVPLKTLIRHTSKRLLKRLSSR